LDWYSGALKKHARRILSEAKRAFKDQVAIAGKVAGIHWYYNHNSHASELMAGYYNTNGRNAYKEIAQIFAEQGAAFDFTCLEMSNHEQDQHCMSNPEGLVHQVVDAIKSEGATFNGENALPRHDAAAYHKVLQRRNDLHAFTYLRLTEELLNDGFNEFRNFVIKMHR
jgi:beta-amylase